jgi:hypothetical protein
MTTVAQLVKTIPAFYGPLSLLPCSQQPECVSHPQTTESNLQHALLNFQFPSSSRETFTIAEIAILSRHWVLASPSLQAKCAAKTYGSVLIA